MTVFWADTTVLGKVVLLQPIKIYGAANACVMQDRRGFSAGLDAS
jgi:hypothetical protein